MHWIDYLKNTRSRLDIHYKDNLEEYYYPNRFICSLAYCATFFQNLKKGYRIRFEDIDRLEDISNQGHIIMPNHKHASDIGIVMHYIVRRYKTFPIWLAAADLLYYISRGGAIPIHRHKDFKAMGQEEHKIAEDYLFKTLPRYCLSYMQNSKNPRNLVVFPEGKRVREEVIGKVPDSFPEFIMHFPEDIKIFPLGIRYSGKGVIVRAGEALDRGQVVKDCGLVLRQRLSSLSGYPVG